MVPAPDPFLVLVLWRRPSEASAALLSDPSLVPVLGSLSTPLPLHPITPFCRAQPESRVRPHTCYPNTQLMYAGLLIPEPEGNSEAIWSNPLILELNKLRPKSPLASGVWTQWQAVVRASCESAVFPSLLGNAASLCEGWHPHFGDRRPKHRSAEQLAPSHTAPPGQGRSRGPRSVSEPELASRELRLPLWLVQGSWVLHRVPLRVPVDSVLGRLISDSAGSFFPSSFPSLLFWVWWGPRFSVLKAVP